jgi:lipoprotein NlpD
MTAIVHASSMQSFRRTARFPLVFVLVACVAIAGCAARSRAPVEDRSAGRGAPATRAATQPPAPIVTAPTNEALPPTYTVKRGDTMHQIALDTGLDYRELAAWNNIENVNRIYVGQVLRLTPPGTPTSSAIAANPIGPEPGVPSDTTATGVVTAPLRAPPPIGEPAPSVTPGPPTSASGAPLSPSPPSSANVKTSPKAIKEPYSEQAVRDMNLAASAIPAPPNVQSPTASSPPSTKADARDATPPARAPASNSTANAPNNASAGAAAANAKDDGASGAGAPSADHLDWAWPARGKIVTNFSETANLKGIDIAGTPGEPVRASAPGRVVYAGNGLRGYGKLIIIKHNDTYLSAYAHNRDILVKEGQQVTRGQKIAEMGNSDADQVKLHFEIRRHGKPMDPTKYLPPL